MENPARVIPNIDHSLSVDNVIKQLELSGVNLGDDPRATIKSYSDAGLLPPSVNDHFPSWVVQRIIAIQDQLAEGKTFEQLKQEISKERRKFLSSATDLNSLVRVYEKFSSNSFFTFFSALGVLILLSGLITLAVVDPKNPVLVAGQNTVNTAVAAGKSVARFAAAPVGQAMVTVIKASKPEDTKSSDPLGLTNIEQERLVIPENILQLDTSGNLNIGSGQITAEGFKGSGENLTDLSAEEIIGVVDLTNLPWTGISENFLALSGLSISLDQATNQISFANTDLGSGQFIFKNIAVSGHSSIISDLNSDTLTLSAGSNITLTTDVNTDTITISSAGGSSNADTLDSLDSLDFLKLSGGTVAGGLTLNSTQTLSSLSFSSGSRVTNTITFNPSAGGTQYGYNLNITNSPTSTANTAIGYNSTIADTSGTLNLIYGFYADTSHLGTTSPGFVTTYGGYFKVRGDTNSSSKTIGIYTDAQGADLDYGVWANGSDYGVYAFGEEGVYGEAVGSFAVYGVHGKGPVGVYGEGNASGWTYGIFGRGTGAITTGPVFAGYFINTATSSTAALERYGVYAQVSNTWNGAGANSYGVYIADATGATNNYGLYQTGTTGTNVFNANTRIGSTTAPTVALDVTGSFNLSGAITAGAVGSTHTLTGMLCVKNTTACPAQSAGSLYVDTAGGAGDDPADVFDIAEYYPASEDVQPGDVLTIDTSGVKTVKKSTYSYDSKLIGIVSTSPAAVIEESFFSIGANHSQYSPRKPYVALVGRVPTKVSTENGLIQPGDNLTSSSIPGVAMKATQSGPTIGKALENYSSSEVGKIMVFVNTGSSINFEDSPTFTLNSTNNYLEEMISKTGEAVFSKVTSAIANFGKLIFGELVVEKSAKSAGNSTLVANQTEIFIASDKVRSDSLINLTADSEPDGLLYIKEKKANEGFVVGIKRLNQNSVKEVKFNWFILNQE